MIAGEIPDGSHIQIALEDGNLSFKLQQPEEARVTYA